MGTLGIIQPSSRLERGGAWPKVTQPVSMELDVCQQLRLLLLLCSL